MNPGRMRRPICETGFPRMRGDEPTEDDLVMEQIAFSPHARG